MRNAHVLTQLFEPVLLLLLTIRVWPKASKARQWTEFRAPHRMPCWVVMLSAHLLLVLVLRIQTKKNGKYSTEMVALLCKKLSLLIDKHPIFLLPSQSKPISCPVVLWLCALTYWVAPVLTDALHYIGGVQHLKTKEWTELFPRRHAG